MNKKLHQAIAIAGHLWNSRSRYGVHSPFVYDLITKGLKAQPKAEELVLIRELRQTIENTRSFHTVDLGSGKNRMLNGNDLLQMSISMRYGKMLYGISKHFQPLNILELGTSAGLSTAFLTLGNRNSEIITVEGCPEKSKIANKIFANHGLSNITMINRDAHAQIELLKKKNYKADLIFIDAGHTYESSMQFFSELMPITSSNSQMIFDDIYWSEGMSRAWKEITADTRVSLSVACLRFGIAFFREGIAKQHFRLRL
jgi:predicted O-methyltransferase YrrM